MKVIFTDEATRDLDEILTYISAHYPAVYRPFEKRLRTIITRMRNWPESGQEVDERPGVRSVPFIRYPYKTILSRNTGSNRSSARASQRT